MLDEIRLMWPAFGVLSVWWKTSASVSVLFQAVVPHFIPEPWCSKFAMGLQTEGSMMGGARGPVGLWTEGPRVTGAPACAKYSSVCSV